jgi:hypothetical protein
MNDQNIPARNKYQIKVVCKQSSPADSSWKDVLTTEIVSTRTSVVDIAARLQGIYPKPEHLVFVHLLARSGQPLRIAWETPDESGNGAV